MKRTAKKAASRKNPKITIDPASWDAGFKAGEQGKVAIAPAKYDSYSWHSGYIEGDAKRQGFKPMGKPRKNPSEVESAAALSEKFHGRPARTEKTVTEQHTERAVLADLGRLIEMTVYPPDGGKPFALQFRSNVRLGCSTDGGQLYFISGDQKLDLSALKLNKSMPKDHLEIGYACSIVYSTSKAFHSFEKSDYEHHFGEDGGTYPTLCYDVQNEKLYLIGGTYQVKPEGIVN